MNNTTVCVRPGGILGKVSKMRRKIRSGTFFFSFGTRTHFAVCDQKSVRRGGGKERRREGEKVRRFGRNEENKIVAEKRMGNTDGIMSVRSTDIRTYGRTNVLIKTTTGTVARASKNIFLDARGNSSSHGTGLINSDELNWT